MKYLVKAEGLIHTIDSSSERMARKVADMKFKNGYLFIKSKKEILLDIFNKLKENPNACYDIDCTTKYYIYYVARKFGIDITVDVRKSGMYIKMSNYKRDRKNARLFMDILIKNPKEVYYTEIDPALIRRMYKGKRIYFKKFSVGYYASLSPIE